MPYIKETITAEEALAMREYFTKRYKRKSKRRLMSLLAKNFDEKDFKRAPLTLRFCRARNKTPRRSGRKKGE